MLISSSREAIGMKVMSGKNGLTLSLHHLVPHAHVNQLVAEGSFETLYLLSPQTFNGIGDIDVETTHLC